MTRYYYETSADGLCEFATKAAAVRHAIKARALRVVTTNEHVVWTNPRGGEHRGLVYGADSVELSPWLQPSLDAR